MNDMQGTAAIHVLDEIVLDAGRIPDALALVDEHYLPEAAVRGLSLLQRWVSPPVAIDGEPNTLWLLWQLPDVPAYYRMRSSTGASVPAFWSALGMLCRQRRRHLLSSADHALLKPVEFDHAA